MTETVETLLRRLTDDDAAARARVVEHARTLEEPSLLVAAALVAQEAGLARALLARASVSARSPRDRQLVAIAAARLAHDTDRTEVLLRDHLADHPDSVLATWLAGSSTPTAVPAPTHHEE